MRCTACNGWGVIKNDAGKPRCARCFAAEKVEEERVLVVAWLRDLDGTATYQSVAWRIERGEHRQRRPT